MAGQLRHPVVICTQGRRETNCVCVCVCRCRARMMNLSAADCMPTSRVSRAAADMKGAAAVNGPDRVRTEEALRTTPDAFGIA